MDINILLSGAGLFLAIFGSVWSLAWWLSGQFVTTRNIIYTQVEKLQKSFNEKLEYHERHDDGRFLAMMNDLNDLKIRNAAIKTLYLNTDEALLTPVSKKIKRLLKEEI